MEAAKELAKKLRSISVAEFFEKNKHILGFDSLQRSLLTCVKEACDNSLDACEDAGILPDIFVEVRRIDRDVYRIVVEDNGPGIVREQVPNIFGKLLYGSRFHYVRQARGQQGIGISAAVLYAQLSTGSATKIISRTSPSKPAYYFEIGIDTAKNEPRVLAEREIEWGTPHGTRVEMEIRGQYVRGKKSVDEYLRNTSIVNPHARITFIDPDGGTKKFERRVNVLPSPPKESKPHPMGVELGMLLKILSDFDGSLIECLCTSFSRVGMKTAEAICREASIDPRARASSLTREQVKNLWDAFKRVKLISPSAESLSPIGEDLLRQSIQQMYRVDFVSAVSRNPSAYSGHPFVVEAALGYGGNLPNDKIELLRFANRVPLLYQQGGCAITQAVQGINWKNYGLEQSEGELPVGPAVLVVHVASTNVPFISESKDAIASVPEIVWEIELALKELGRNLRSFLSARERLERRREKENLIQDLIPQIALKVSETLGRKPPDVKPVIAKIMGNVLVQKVDGGIRVKNFSQERKEFKLICRKGKVEREWNLSLQAGEEKMIRFVADEMRVDGIPNEAVTL